MKKVAAARTAPRSRALMAASVLIFLVALNGCLIRRREKITRAPVAPNLVSATIDELLAKIQQQQDQIRTFEATATVEPSVNSANKDEIVHYHDVRTFFLIRRPASLRMIGQTPVVRSTAFDLASDGKDFELYIPSKSRFIVGSATSGKRSASPLENLRPQHIIDALLWNSPEAGREEAAMEAMQEGQKYYYVLYVFRRGSDPVKLQIARKVWFERAGLSVERLQIFDPTGAVATDAQYSDYTDFGGIHYPKKVKIERPLDGYGLTLDFEQLRVNGELEDAKFRLEQPSGTQLIRLEELPEVRQGGGIG